MFEESGKAGSSSKLIESAELTSEDEEGGAPGDMSIAQTVAPGDDEQGEVEDDVDDEDDYRAAWEVLDVARTIYAKVVENLKDGQGREERLCLAECFLALGDVSLETG